MRPHHPAEGSSFVEHIEEHTTRGRVVLQQTPFDQKCHDRTCGLVFDGIKAWHPAPKFCPRPEPQCQPSQRVHASHQRSPVTSSISYTMKTGEKRSNNVAPSLNHGFRAPENTFSLQSRSMIPQIARRGNTCFQTPATPLHVTLIHCSLVLRRPLPT